MAVIAIMTAVVAASVFKRLRETERDAESLAQEALCEALQKNILRFQRLPAPSNLVATLAQDMLYSQDALTRTRSRAARRLVFDPNFRVGPGLTPLPYFQTNTGSQLPVNPRFLVVSSLLGELPGEGDIAANFQQIWDTPRDAVPASFPAAWNGRGQDIRITRCDLAPLFHRLVLNNLDLAAHAPYSVEATNAILLIPPLQRVEAWFLRGTVVNLHYTNRLVQMRETVLEEASYVFEHGRWGRYMIYGRGRFGGNFGQIVDAFLAAPEPPQPKFGATKQAIVDEMFNFMWNYGLWSDTGFSTGGSTSDGQVPPYRVLEDARKRLGDISYNLLN